MEQAVNHYRLVRKLGSGGMGEVYLAEDTRLKRNVALKFLPDHLSKDPDFKARFEHEAQAVAALDHPNIISIYELGEHNGRLYIAMQYLDGRTLQEMLDTEEIPLKDAIKIVEQTCSGLAKAHEEGVIHRDIKPANIFVTTEGVVKILDFGLAKSRRSTTQTKTGTTVGTLQYESPEQCRGEKVDRRSDIFSVGVLLYQLITGRLPFTGDYDAAIIYAISHETPEPIARYKSGATDELQRVIDKAIAKEPGHRYQHIDDMLADIRRPHEDTPVSNKKRKRLVVWVISLAMIAGALSMYLTVGSENEERVKPIRRRQVTFFGDVHSGSLSPDGQFLAIVRGEYGGIAKPEAADSMRVLVQDLGGGDPIEVFSDWLIADAWWTPDGRELLIRGDNQDLQGFYKIPRLGGEPRFYPLEGIGSYWRVTWSPDGSQFAAASDYWTKTYFVVDVATGKTTPYTLEGDFDWIFGISWIPETDSLLVIVNNADGNRDVVTPARGSGLQEVGRGFKIPLRWTADGTVLRYTSGNGDLMSAGFDKKALQWLDDSRLLVPEVVEPYGKSSLDSSFRRLSYLERTTWSNIRTANLDKAGTIGSTHMDVTAGTALHGCPAFSGDGEYLLYAKQDDGSPRIYILNLETGGSRRISYPERSSFGGAWSPDDTRIAYAITTGSVNNLAIYNVADGATSIYDSCIVNGNNPSHSPVTWASDSLILYETPGARELMSFDLVTKTPARVGPPKVDGTWMFFPIGSPVAKELVFFWTYGDDNVDHRGDSSVRTGIWISSRTGENARLLIPFAMPIGWSRDGEWVYAWRFKEKLALKVSITSGVVDTVGYLPDAFLVGLDIAPQAGKVGYTYQESSKDLWLIDNVPRR